MSCNISDGIGRPPCPGETPGAKDTFYLFNRSQVTAFIGGGGTCSNITFSGGAGFYQVVATKNSVIGREKKNDTKDSSTDYTHEVDFALTDLSFEARTFVNDMNGASLGVIIRTKGDKFILFGVNEGLEMKVNNMTTESNGLGEFVTLRVDQEKEKTWRFYDTSLAATIAHITSNIVGS